MNKYRCETCNKSTFTRGVNWLNGGVLCNGHAILPDGVATISEKGCASHSELLDMIDNLETVLLERVNGMSESDNIKHLFIEVMDIVKLQRKLSSCEDKLEQNRSRYNVDRRLLNSLKNEYERSLEEPDYKMKSVDEIKFMIKKVDEEADEIDFAPFVSGDTVRFVEKNPTTFAISAMNSLKLDLGEIYTVDRVEVHSWHTKVFLKEVPDVEFNSVWFEVVDVK